MAVALSFSYVSVSVVAAARVRLANRVFYVTVLLRPKTMSLCYVVRRAFAMG